MCFAAIASKHHFWALVWAYKDSEELSLPIASFAYSKKRDPRVFWCVRACSQDPSCYCRWWSEKKIGCHSIMSSCLYILKSLFVLKRWFSDAVQSAMMCMCHEGRRNLILIFGKVYNTMNHAQGKCHCAKKLCRNQSDVFAAALTGAWLATCWRSCHTDVERKSHSRSQYRVSNRWRTACTGLPARFERQEKLVASLKTWQDA